MKERGVLTIISGFSGAGKGTVVKELMNQHDNYCLSVSATTRKPRPGEVAGVDYHYVTHEAFTEMIEKKELFEYAQYCDNYYGTPKDYVLEKLLENKDVILEIELQGALQVKECYSEALLIFIVPPSIRELRDRLVGRGTETKEVIEQRMHRAFEELAYINKYDFLVVNDILQDAVDDVHHVVISEKHKIARNLDVKESLRKEFEAIMKEVK